MGSHIEIASWTVDAISFVSRQQRQGNELGASCRSVIDPYICRDDNILTKPTIILEGGALMKS